MDCKEQNFGNASSVNFEFLFFSGVHIATCAQKSGFALFKLKEFSDFLEKVVPPLLNYEQSYAEGAPIFN